MGLQKMKVISLVLSKLLQKFTHKEIECQFHVCWGLLSDEVNEIFRRELANTALRPPYWMNFGRTTNASSQPYTD